MSIRGSWRASLSALLAATALACGSVQAQEVAMATGEHWTRSSPEVKKAYLVGLANAMHVETAYQGANPPGDAQTIVPRFARGMRGQTLDGVRDFLDGYYAKNPDKRQRPVIETIWFELVVPGLAKQR